MTERRILSLWLPRLAIERWAKGGGQRCSANHSPNGPFAPLEAPVALTEEAAHGPMIVAVTDAAAARGARPGMRLTDARALDPGLQAVAADVTGDAALLARLARWASRWSPLVEIDGADGLRLDVAGVAHLFGGEAGLVRDIERRFAAMGLSVRVAVAETAGAAWALARFSPSPFSSPSPLCGRDAGIGFVRPYEVNSGMGPLGAAEGEGEGSEQLLSVPSPRSPAASRPLPQGGEGLDTLAPLPVAALRLPPGPTRTLERLGLKTIGQLAGVPRRSLARRFREADNPLDALDRMLGRTAEPLSATPCAPPPRAMMRLAEPVTDPAVGGQALARLVPELVRQLEARRLGVRRLHLAGYRIDGSVAGTGVATAIASRDPAHLLRLLGDRAAALDPEYGFDGFALEASWCEPLCAAQDLLVEEPRGEVEVAKLVDRLSVKLGADKVRRPQTRESHLPERASGWRAALGPVTAVDLASSLAPRPQRLLDAPEPIGVIYATPEGLPRRFVWRRGVHDISRVEGPERISPEWWRSASGTRLRDYYRVEDSVGRRFWIYREGVHGDGRGGAPAWYMHGLFG